LGAIFSYRSAYLTARQHLYSLCMKKNSSNE
jgi:hypothetical protein